MTTTAPAKDQEDGLVFVEALWSLRQSFRRDPLQQPFFDALKEGRLLGSRDPASGRVSFPPRALVEESFGFADALVPVSPGGTIRTVTRQPARGPVERPPLTAVFVQLDGADTAAAGRLRGPGADAANPASLIGRRCRLVIAAAPKGAWSDYWFELESAPA